MITYALIVTACAMLVLVYYVYTARTKSSHVRQLMETPAPKERTPCILCGARLEKGQRVTSELFKGEKDSFVRVYGCPFCYGPDATNIRTCPVCKNKMGADDYLQGRMWLKKNGKQHLHISGCSRCLGKKK